MKVLILILIFMASPLASHTQSDEQLIRLARQVSNETIARQYVETIGSF